MKIKEADILRKLNPKRIMIPVLLGLTGAFLLLYFNLGDTRFEEVAGDVCGEYEWIGNHGEGIPNFGDRAQFRKVDDCRGSYRLRTYQDTLGDIHWTWYSSFWFFMALLAVVARDLAYMYRIRVLTDYELSWRRSFRVIMLWEFASALTPSVVGGSGVAMFIINRERIKLGKSTAIVMVSALLDELFYITMVAVVLIAVGTADLFPVNLQKSAFGFTFGTQGIFWIGYAFIFAMTVAILLGIFIMPRSLKYILLNVFRLPVLRRWRYQIIEVGDDIITASIELKGKNRLWWFKASASTFVSWTARYWVVNFLILAFANPTNPIVQNFGDHMLVYARQLVMWVIMLISPTPGGSGIAEFAFSGFLKEFIPLGLVGALALIWRLITYYPYLFAGAIILPRWIKATSRKEKKADKMKQV